MPLRHSVSSITRYRKAPMIVEKCGRMLSFAWFQISSGKCPRQPRGKTVANLDRAQSFIRRCFLAAFAACLLWGLAPNAHARICSGDEVTYCSGWAGDDTSSEQYKSRYHYCLASMKKCGVTQDIQGPALHNNNEARRTCPHTCGTHLKWNGQWRCDVNGCYCGCSPE